MAVDIDYGDSELPGTLADEDSSLYCQVALAARGGSSYNTGVIQGSTSFELDYFIGDYIAAAATRLANGRESSEVATYLTTLGLSSGVSEQYVDVAIAVNGVTDSNISGGFWLGYYKDETAYEFGADSGDGNMSAKIYFMVNNNEDTDYPTTYAEPYGAAYESGGTWAYVAIDMKSHEVGQLKAQYEKETFNNSYNSAIGNLVGIVLSSSGGIENILNFKRTLKKPLKEKNTSIFEGEVITTETVGVARATMATTPENGAY